MEFWEKYRKRPWITHLAIAQLVILSILFVRATPGSNLIPRPLGSLLQQHKIKKPTLVIASYKTQDVSWLARIPEGWDVKRYCTDCPKNEPLKDEFGTTLPVPFTLGREAMAYLTFLIDHHDDPPPYTVFVHGHNTSYHQPVDVVTMLRAIDFSSIDAQDYIPLKCLVQACDTDPSVMDLTRGPVAFPDAPFTGALKMMPAWWKVTFENKEEPEDQIAAPYTHKAVGGGQFALSRAIIKKTPLSRLKRLRRPLESKKNLLSFDHTLRKISVDTWGFYKGHDTLADIFRGGSIEDLNDYAIGSLFELTWGPLFGQFSLFCPNVHTCQTLYFSNAINCTGWIAMLGENQNVTCSTNEKNMARVAAKNKARIDDLNSAA